ncbi:hypothetical protein CVT24_012222 [Panaeolus cyanescens]|uniref:F-box domain-containing protein n=1 Tax=Panaeolus cyanescens TaxID=181874 RepID=A0A409VYT9_9AGAR|nr:hypothetical protein CVT24_012222 [Panaeolus cyanescens]
MSTNHVLPFELVSHIILLASEDSASLLTLALVSRHFHHEAIRHLYAVSPPVRLGISTASSPAMRFIQVVKRSMQHAAMVRHFIIAIVSYDEKIIDIVRALERMVNLETLEVRHIYIEAAHGLMDLTPTLFDNPKYKFRLKSLLWLSNRQQIALLRLGELIALHRESLEVLRVNFYSDARDMTHDINIRIMTAVQPLTSDDANIASSSVSTTRSIWPLPRLHTLVGTQETLDIFFPLAQQQISKLKIIAPSGSQFYHPKGSPDPKQTTYRFIECLKHNPIRVFHIDFFRNGNIHTKLQDITFHLPLVECLRLNQPNVQSIAAALQSMKKLRVLLMTVREHTTISDAIIHSIFSSCPLLVQIEVGFAQDSDGNFLYTRWWMSAPFAKTTGQEEKDDTRPTLRRAGNFVGPSQYFLQSFS